MQMRHRALPSPIVPLIFGFGGDHELVSDTEDLTAASFCGGLMETSVSVMAPTYYGLQVDLTPSAAARLVGAPAHELTGRLHDVRDVLGTPGEALFEQLQDAAAWPERFHLTASFLRRRFAGARSAATDVEYAWSLLGAMDGMMGVRSLAAEVGWSERRLRQLFHSHVGVSPKRAARLFRFQHATHLLTDRRSLSLAAVAERCGFSDQAHLSNEVKRMSGLTASALRGHGRGGVFED